MSVACVDPGRGLKLLGALLPGIRHFIRLFEPGGLGARGLLNQAFSEKHCLLVLAVLAAFLSQQATAQPAYREGIHYVELTIPVRTGNPQKIEVTEYFSYGCPHCYQMEAQVEAWKEDLGEDVVFDRTPAIWNQSYQVYAQTYYTLEAMSLLNRLHAQVFDAIHRRGKRLDGPELMAGFLADHGVDPEEFARTYQSFAVSVSMRQAQARGRAYRASGVPAMIVNGKYRIEGSMAGSNRAILDVVDFLIEQERLAAGSD